MTLFEYEVRVMGKTASPQEKSSALNDLGALGWEHYLTEGSTYFFKREKAEEPKIAARKVEEPVKETANTKLSKPFNNKNHPLKK